MEQIISLNWLGLDEYGTHRENRHKSAIIGKMAWLIYTGHGSRNIQITAIGGNLRPIMTAMTEKTRPVWQPCPKTALIVEMD